MNKKNSIEIMVFFFIVPILFIWPAIYNGFPFMYGDSPKYLEIGAGLRWVPERPSFYPFLAISGPFVGSLFYSILLQAFIITFLLYFLFVKVNGIRPYLAILLASVLAIFTPLAWWVDMIMTEMFLVVIVTIFSFIVLNKWNNWSLTSKIIAVFLLLSAMLMHITYTYTIVISTFLVILIRIGIYRNFDKNIGLLLGLCIFALVSYPTLNALKGYGFSNSEVQSPVYKFLIARIGGDGIITEDDLRWFLRNEKDDNNIKNRIVRLKKINQNNSDIKNNKIKHYISNNARNTNSFQGYEDTESPFFSWDENKYMSYKDMVFFLIQKHPIENLTAIINGTYRLWTFPYMAVNKMHSPIFGDVIKNISPSDYSLFINSKGIANKLTILVPILDPLFAIFYMISLISIVLALIFCMINLWKSHSFEFLKKNSIGLSLLMVLLILIHSMLIYTFGGDFTRYGSRVAIAVDVAGLNIMINASITYMSRKKII